MKKYLNFPFIIALAFFLVGNVFAQTFNLYEQPKPDSKVVGTIDSTSGMVAIFNTPDGQWIKVGDPQNGNVGWVKKSDLGKEGLNFNMIQGTTTGGQKYQVIQFGNTKPMTQEEAAQAAKQAEIRRQQLQQDAEKLMKGVVEEMKQIWNSFPALNAPQGNQPAAAIQPQQKGKN